MKVVIASAGSPDYAELAAVTNPTKARYAEKHGYTFMFAEIDKETGDACKREMYTALADKGFDVFVWIDLDAAVMNSDIKIENIINQYMDDGHFLWAWDFAGPNSGVYICRYTPEGAHWLERAYATMLENGLADETAMEMLRLSAPFNKWVRECPGTVMNAYPYEVYGWDKYGTEHGDKINAYRPGRFIMHLPGLPNEKRIEIFRSYGVTA